MCDLIDLSATTIVHVLSHKRPTTTRGDELLKHVAEGRRQSYTTELEIQDSLVSDRPTDSLSICLVLFCTTIN